MYKLLFITTLVLLNHFYADRTLAACPGLINGGDVTIVAGENCSLSAQNNYYLDKATSESSTTNDSTLTLTGGSLTISNTSSLTVGKLVPAGGSIIIQNGGAIDLKSTPSWVVDSDADGYPLNFTTYTATASGRRRLGLMKTTPDCNDNSAHVYRTLSNIAIDSDQDGYSPSPGTIGNECVGAQTTHASGRVYYRSATGNFDRLASNQLLSSTADCYDGNANARPGQTACFTAHRGDNSFDYNCGGTSVKCGTIYNRSTTSNWTATDKTCIGATGSRRCGSQNYNNRYPTGITTTCGQFAGVCSAWCTFDESCDADGARCYKSGGYSDCCALTTGTQGCN